MGTIIRSTIEGSNIDLIVQIRYVPQISGLFTIVDDQTVFIQTEKEDNCFSVKTLISNNPSLVAILKDYYQTIWEKKPQKHQ